MLPFFIFLYFYTFFTYIQSGFHCSPEFILGKLSHFMKTEGKKILEKDCVFVLKVHMTPNFFIDLLGRAFKVMKNGVYFIVIAFLVAELFKVFIYAN